MHLRRWRDSRGHRGALTLARDGRDEREVFRLGHEWSWGYFTGLGFDIGADDEDGIRTHLLLGPASMWLHLRFGVRPWSDRTWLKVEVSRMRDAPWTIQAEVWQNRMNPERYLYWPIRDRLARLLFGRETFQKTEEPLGIVRVPMEEGTYLAAARREVYTWKRPRWPWARTRDAVWLSFERPGIPFWGKGENSWDCGMDGLYGTGGDTIEDAIANAVRSVLKYRRTRGWKPEDLLHATVQG